LGVAVFKGFSNKNDRPFAEAIAISWLTNLTDSLSYLSARGA
jgi:hypothetical protein